MGANGVPGPDDLFYPTLAVPVSSYLATVTVSVSRTNTASVGPLAVTVGVTCRLDGGFQTPPPAPVPLVTFPFMLPRIESRSWTYQVTPGAVRIVVNTNDQIADLMPGEFKTLAFQFD